jgi:transposase
LFFTCSVYSVGPFARLLIADRRTHKESISIAVTNSVGKVVMESVLETKASMILQFIDGLRGDVQVTFEEGTSAAWLYDLLKPHVTKLVVCDPRKNKSMREGNQNDKIDARRLAELLRLDHLTPVYHGEHGLRALKELVRSYLTITKDLARVKSRVTNSRFLPSESG